MSIKKRLLFCRNRTIDFPNFRKINKIKSTGLNKRSKKINKLPSESTKKFSPNLKRTKR